MGPGGPKVVATLCGHEREKCVRARAQYLAALEGAGFDVIALDPHGAVPAHFDALCLTGGGDIEPSRYGEAAAPETDDLDPDRDDLELRLLRQALDNGFKDGEELRKQKDLEPLREREDFQKLANQLDQSQKP